MLVYLLAWVKASVEMLESDCYHIHSQTLSRTFTQSHEALQTNLATRPLKIVFDSQNLVSSTIEAGFKMLITTILLPKLEEWSRTVLRVKQQHAITFVPPSACGSYVTIPANYSGVQADIDLLIFVSAEKNQTARYIGRAFPCCLSPVDGRPTIGYMGFNTAFMALVESSFEYYTRVAMHELMHILALNPDLFPHFVSTTPTQVISEGRTYIATPKVVSFVRNHLNCSNAPGALLEDEGGVGSAGSHFERSMFGNELMTSQIAPRTALSGLTLALLEDSGWYLVSTETAEILLWGRSQGCGFPPKDCSDSFGEFCPVAGEESCTTDFQGGTVCAKDAFTNGCLVKSFTPALFCLDKAVFVGGLGYQTNARGSQPRCFEVQKADNTTLSACFPAKCNDQGRVEFSVGRETFTCSTAGSIVVVEELKVKCPDLSKFCTLQGLSACSSGCSRNGYCRIDGKCNCRYGFSGEDCVVDISCTKNSTSYCNQLFPNSPHLSSVATIALYSFLLSLNAY